MVEFGQLQLGTNKAMLQITAVATTADMQAHKLSRSLLCQLLTLLLQRKLLHNDAAFCFCYTIARLR